MAETFNGPLTVPIGVLVVHLSLELDGESGFDVAYCEPASSQRAVPFEGKRVVEFVPYEVAVSVGAAGKPPPDT